MYIKLKARKPVEELTDEDMKRIYQEFANADRQNQVIYRNLLAKHQQLLALAAEIYTADSNEYRYLKQHAPSQPVGHANAYKTLEKKYEREKALRIKRERERDRRARSKEAAVILEEIGYRRGVHFHSENALTFMKNNLIEVEQGVYAPMFEDETLSRRKGEL